MTDVQLTPTLLKMVPLKWAYLWKSSLNKWSPQFNVQIQGRSKYTNCVSRNNQANTINMHALPVRKSMDKWNTLSIASNGV
jgi:hypothetical protein